MALRTKIGAAVVGLALVATAWLGSGPAARAEEPAQADLGRGAQLFELCAQCHGPEAQGNAMFLAPSIAGLDKWYIEMQLHEFRKGFRGHQFDDISGMRMRPMALTLYGEKDVVDVAAYVASLPRANPKRTLPGDPEAGKALFTLCAACHGANAQGTEAMKAPPLYSLNDWYLVAQLEKFKAGIRGTQPGDPYGVLMGPNSPMAATLRTDEQVRDVVAHIASLGN